MHRESTEIKKKEKEKQKKKQKKKHTELFACVHTRLCVEMVQL